MLVFPFRYDEERGVEYAIFQRAPSSGGFWQGIAGGGIFGETPVITARRESFEEARIPQNSNYIVLDSIASIPVLGVCDSFRWGSEILVIPEHAFGVDATDHEVVISKEHIDFRWLNFDKAHDILKYDSNKVALWELNQRLMQNNPATQTK